MKIYAKDGTRLRDPDYLAWIRTKRCVFHPQKDGEPMHGKPWARGMKGPDYAALPGCRECHVTEESTVGRKRFWQGIDRDFLVESYNRAYCAETGTTLRELRGK